MKGQSGRKCEYCWFLQVAGGLSRPVFVCNRKEGAHKQLQVVQACDVCANFIKRPPRLPIELGEAEIEEVRLIPLTRGQFAIVDLEDYAELAQYKWHAVKSVTTYYAVRSGPGQMHIRMHRVLTNAPAGMVVDHIDRNGLNNRKSNLRICTPQQNVWNRCFRPQSSVYKGVYFDKANNWFKASICYNGKRFHLGHFKNEIKAAKTYDKKAIEFFGEFAYLNFPR